MSDFKINGITPLIGNIKTGTTNVSQIYAGSTLVWPMIQPPTPPPVITTVTEINIWFDSSGSMNSTLAPLVAMQNTLLKNRIGPIYGYNPAVPGSDALYNTRVKVISSPNEQFISWLATQRNYNRTADTTVNQVLNLTFADESDVYGATSGTFNNMSRTSQYNIDIASLRVKLTATPYIKGVAFRVNTGPNIFPGFRGLTQATFVDSGVYVNPYNISDLATKFFYDLDVVAGVPGIVTPIETQASYYLTKVVSGLNTLGFVV